MINKSKEFYKYTAKPSESIKTCMARIEANKKGTLIIINDDNLLLGSLSDGDIRRSILAGKGVNDSVEAAYNRNPIKYFEPGIHDLARQIFFDKKIGLLPIVDSNNYLVAISTPGTEQKYPAVMNYVVLMVGGEGQRLGDLTLSTPKPLLRVGDKPILQTILERLEYFGFRNVVLCTRYLSEAIEEFCSDGARFGLKISYFKEKEKLGTVGAVKHLESKLKEPFLVMNGDLLTSLNYKNILDFHISNDNAMTVGCTTYTYKVPYGVIEIDGMRVKKILEKPTYTHRVSGGIYVLNQDVLSLIPKDQYFDMTDLMEEVISQGQFLNAFPIEEYWLDVGLPNDFLRANQDYNQLFK